MLEKVVRLGKSVTEVADTRTTMERIWHGVHDDLEFDRLAIFLYNTDDMSIDDTFGTNNRGEMVDEWHIRFPFSEAALFMRVLERPDGLYFTHNYDVENNIPEEDEMYGVKEYAAVAVWAGNKPVAVICVDHLITGRPISEEQLEALKLFAGYAGLAIENSHLNDALQIELQQQRQSEEKEARRRLMLEKVVSLGQQVTEVNDLTTTLKKIWHGVHDELLFDRLAIFLYDSVQSSVRGTLGTNNQGQIVEEWDFIRPVIQSESTSFKRALESPTGLFVTKDFAGEFNIPQGHEMYDVKDFASVAAWAGEKPVAIITVDNAISRLPFTEEQLEALRMFGGYAGLAIENARLNMVLQDELTQRQDLINELEAKNAELERFTYTVSHDLKSPLVTITGFLGFLEQDALSGNIERIKSGVNRISGAAQKMQALLNDLLELSRVGRLMNPPEDIPFTEIVNEAIDRVHGSINEIDAVVETQPEFPVIHGDRVRLVEVVQNLIDNALKYSNPETRTRVEIGTDGTNEKGSPVFFVRDNGIGIDPQYHERIFGLFNKLDNSSKGTGIGLSLVKRIIEVHNGRIWVESQLGQGSTFFFSLPTPPSKE
jgi:signal transduction histidine kinase